MLWPLETDPVNTRERPQWLVCHKDRIVSREEYPELFKLIGVGWGEGDYETTFNLPEPYDTPRGMNYIIRAK